MLAEFKPTPAMRSAMDGPRVGVGTCVVYENHGGVFEAQCCWVRPGGRKLIITGGAGEVLKQCANVAYLLVCSYASVIEERLTPLSCSPKDLVRSGCDVHIHLVWELPEISHCAYKGAMALSFISLMAERRPRPGVGIAGDVTPTGRLLQDPSDWKPEIVARCFGHGFRHMVIANDLDIPENVTGLAATLAEDGQPYLRFLRREFIWDAFGDIFC